MGHGDGKAPHNKEACGGARAAVSEGGGVMRGRTRVGISPASVASSRPLERADAAWCEPAAG